MKNLSIIFVITFVLISFFSKELHGQLEVQKHWHQPNGEVFDIEIDEDNNTVYVGGNFNSFGLKESYLFLSDTSSNITYKQESPNGVITAVISDNNGGWYVGGNFTMIGDSVRSNLAHYDSEGKLTSWTANANDIVTCFYIRNDTLFVGGEFNNINGVSRGHIAAFSISTGDLLAWNPYVTGFYLEVKSIQAFNNNLYVAGNFNEANGQPRDNFAVYDLTTGNLDPWNPGVGSNSSGHTVEDMLLLGDTIFVCGNINEFDSQPVSKLFAFDASTKSMINFTPDIQGGYPKSIDISDDTLYVGGTFNSVNSVTRNYFAAINRVTGNLNSWAPNINHNILSVKVVHEDIYLGGAFDTVNSVKRNHLAAFNLNSGNLKSIDFGFNSNVYSIANYDDNLAFGGYFYLAYGETRKNIAALNLNSGELLPWNPDIDDVVYTLCLYDNELYVGGDFEEIDNQQRTRLASFSTQNGQLSSLNHYIITPVYSIDASDGEIYIGGSFNSIGSGVGAVSRSKLASFQASTGNLTNWNPSATSSSSVRSVICKDNYVYVGGSFNEIGGQSINRIARIDKNTGSLTQWDPNPNQYSQIFSMAAHNNTIYVGGTFNTIGGAPRDHIASLDANALTNNATSWNPMANEEPLCFLASDSVVFCGGNFTEIGGQNVNYITVLGKTSAAPISSIYMNANDKVEAIARSKKHYFFGGSFSTFNGYSRNFAVLKDTCIADTPTIQASDNNICPGNTVTLSVTSGDLNYSTDWEWYKNGCGEIHVGSGSSIDVTPSGSTIYYVRGEGGCGLPNDCAKLTILVNNTQQPSGSTTHYFCPYDNATLNDISVNGNNIQWYSSSSGGTPLANSTNIVDGQTYYATQTLNGCESVNRLGVTASIVNINTNVTQQGFTLSALQNGSDYQWLNCDNNYSLLPGATYQSFTPIANGNYAVQLNLNGCLDTSDCYTINSLSINENDLNDKLRVYPNPTGGKISIELHSETKISQIKIMDSNGKLVHLYSDINRNVFEIDFSDLAKGVYFLEMKLEDNSIVSRKVSRK